MRSQIEVGELETEAGGQNKNPVKGVDDLEDDVEGEKHGDNLAEQLVNTAIDQLPAGNLFDPATDQGGESRSGSNGRQHEEKEGPGPDEEARSKGKGTGKQHPGNPAQRSLMEEAEEGSGKGEDGHQFVEGVAKHASPSNFIDFAVLEDDGRILDG